MKSSGAFKQFRAIMNELCTSKDTISEKRKIADKAFQMFALQNKELAAAKTQAANYQIARDHWKERVHKAEAIAAGLVESLATRKP
jgi:hypothetical protein